MARTEKPFRLRKRGAVWYYKTPTMQNFRTTEETSRAKAERKVVKLLSIGMAGKRNPSFKEYAEPFFDYERCPHVARLKAEKKRIGEGYCKKERKALILYVFPSKMARKPIADITRGDILDLRDELIKERISGNIINRALKAIKVVFSEALFRQDIPYNPASGIGEVATNNKEAAIFTPEQLCALFSNPEKSLVWRTPVDYICFLIAACTGMRRGEILALKWKNIHLDRGYIHVEEAWKEDWTRIGSPKSGKSRDTSIPYALAYYLERYYQSTPYNKPDDFVICKEDGTAYSQQRWYKAFNRALETAGIEKPKDKRLKPHSLRHSLNTILRNSGTNPALIRDMLGWADESIQDHYTHNDIPYLAEKGAIADVISPAILPDIAN